MMKRRRFLGLFAATSVAAPLRVWAQGQGARADSVDVDDVDPYFLQSGDLSPDEQQDIAEFVGYQQRLVAGQDAIMPRSGRPQRAPTFRFLYWDGELGSPAGAFVSPLSVQPQLRMAPAYELNAQVLGFRCSSDDWGRRAQLGTLSVEFRARLGGEPMTWLYAQQFEAYRGATTLGREYVGQREGVLDPIVTDEPNIDLRIQLMRESRSRGLLGKIMKMWALILGVASGFGATAGAAAQAMPALRITRLLPEGVAFSQALFGGTARQTPLWRSGFTTYAVAEGGSRLRVRPGFWVVIDESREVNLVGVRLEDVGGEIRLTRDGEPLDANYLVLSLEVAELELPRFNYPGLQDPGSRDVVPKGIPPQQPDKEHNQP